MLWCRFYDDRSNIYKLLSLGELKNHRLVTLTTDRIVYEIRGIHLILLNKTTFIANQAKVPNMTLSGDIE